MSLSGTQAFKRLLKYTISNRVPMFLAIIGMVIYSFSQGAFVALTQPLLDNGFTKNAESENVFISKTTAWLESISGYQIDVIGLLMMSFVGIFLIRGIGTFLTTYFIAFLGRSIIRRLREELFDQILAIPAKVYDQLSSGELISMFSYHVEQVAESATSAVTTIVRDSFTITFLFILMFYYDPILTMIFVVVGPLIAIIVFIVNMRVRKVSKRIQESMGGVTHVVSEAVDGHRVVKIFGGETYEANNFERVNQYNFKQHLKLALTMAYSVPVIQVIAGFAFAGIIYVATSDIIQQPLSPGEFMGFVGAVVLLFQPIRRLTQVSSVLQKGIAAVQSIFAFIDGEREKNYGHIEIGQAKGEIEYQSVSFSYDTDDNKSILRSIDLKVKPGETIALVGRSGSGKSTMVNLLPRFYDAQQGKILLDGRDIQDYTLNSLRDQISYVGQSVTLFNDTVANNIAYGQLAETSREDIIQAIRSANAFDFIQNLPQGLDTIIGEDGILLSGGQRQRLAIARALLKNSPILILDEATSALDTESEQLIQDALDKLILNRTTFVIAHRLSTVEKADRIIVLENGEAVEMGTHKELLELDGRYASLYHLQFNTDILADEKPKSDAGLPAPIQPPQDRMNFLKEEQGATIWERVWYGHHPLVQLLMPVSYLFNLLVWLRKQFYNVGLLKRHKLNVPVIVVGNLTVGGTGKTPLVIWLAQYLKDKGYKPGIISRGYKGKSKTWPVVVTPEIDSEIVGDEALLMVMRSGCPTVVGPNRVECAQKLLSDYPVDIIISDDGLQHYALQRDIEIVVADGSRGFGNGLLLPAGPLREPKSRLKSVDLIVINGASLPDSYGMFVKGEQLSDLTNPQNHMSLDALVGKSVHAIAAIGNPDRYFDLLRRHGLTVIEHAHPDHYEFMLTDLMFDDDLLVIMTEKDAVKCRKFADHFERNQVWYLPIDAELPQTFEKAVALCVESVAHE